MAMPTRLARRSTGSLGQPGGEHKAASGSRANPLADNYLSGLGEALRARTGSVKVRAAFDPPAAAFPCSRFLAERCQSGRSGRSRKPLCVQAYRGFESHPLRQYPA